MIFGCVFALLLINLTQVCIFRKALKMKAIKIFLNILINLEISLILFKVGVTRTENKYVCIGITASIHYFLLVTWCWKTAYAYEIYLSLVKVIRNSINYLCIYFHFIRNLSDSDYFNSLLDRYFKPVKPSIFKSVLWYATVCQC